MPHTKRKGATKSLLPKAITSTPTQQTLDHFLQNIPLETGLASPMLSPDGGASALLGYEVSLTPPELIPPPCPASTRDGETPLDAEGAARGTSFGKLSRSSEGEDSKSQENPGEVTLTEVWKAVQALTVAVTKSTNEFATIVSKLEKFDASLEKIKNDVNTQTQQTQIEINGLKSSVEALIKDKQIIHRKIELMENNNRRLNLRLLNFPISSLIKADELFKMYLKEILQLPASNLPPYNKVYYLPLKKGLNTGPAKNLQGEHQELHDLTAFLEDSNMDITDRGTLLVQFVFEQDLNHVFKLYFKNSTKMFYGQKIWIYPDVAKATQDRRKQFLDLRNDIRALGASFLLAYPCKCRINFQGNKYVFSDPLQLRSFLEMKKIQAPVL